MLGNITFTLYEIFGYLLPGFIALAGMVVLYWSLFLHHAAIPIYRLQFDTTDAVLIVLACYLLGHTMQALANIWCKGLEEAVLGEEGSAPKEFVQTAKSRATTILGAVPSKLGAMWLFKVMDDFRVQEGVAGDRDIFVYREGFYKGSSTASGLLALAFIVRTIVPGAALKFTEYTHNLSRWETAFLALCAGATACLLARRSRRFGEYRVSHALVGFLVKTGTSANASAATPASAK